MQYYCCRVDLSSQRTSCCCKGANVIAAESCGVTKLRWVCRPLCGSPKDIVTGRIRLFRVHGEAEGGKNHQRSVRKSNDKLQRSTYSVIGARVSRASIHRKKGGKSRIPLIIAFTFTSSSRRHQCDRYLLLDMFLGSKPTPFSKIYFAIPFFVSINDNKFLVSRTRMRVYRNTIIQLRNLIKSICFSLLYIHFFMGRKNVKIERFSSRESESFLSDGNGRNTGFSRNLKIDVGTGEIVGNNSRRHGGPHTRSRMNPWRVLTCETKVFYIHIHTFYTSWHVTMK